MEESKSSEKKLKIYNPNEIISELEKLKPIEKKYAELFDKTEEIILSQYKTIQRLSNIVVKDDNEGIENISKTISESYEEFKQQLQIAQYVQKAIFPKVLPSNEFLYINAKLFPMGQTSSDFYDVFEILKKRVYGIVVVDVSGYGVSAALVTSMVKMLFSNAVSKYLSPKLVLNYVNKELAKTLKQSSNLSCFYCVIDLYEKDIVYVTAGHTGNLYYKSEKSEFETLSTRGKKVGLIEKYEYEEKRVKFEYGDKFIVYTDGLITFENESGEKYNHNSLLNILNNNCDKKSDELFKLLVNDIENYTDISKLSDDITFMFIDISKEAKGEVKRGLVKVEESSKLIDYYKKLLRIKEQNSDKEGIIDALLNISEIRCAIGKYDKAISHYSDALDLSYGLKDKNISIKIIDKLADLYLNTGNLKKAIIYINKNLKHYKNIKNEERLMETYTLLSQVYYRQNKLRNAQKYEIKSLKIAKKKNKKLNMAVSYNKLGVYYHTENNFDKAMKYYNKGTAIIDSLEEGSVKAKMLNNIGDIHRGFGNLDKALNLFHKSLEILKKWEDKLTYAIVLHNIGELYIINDKVDTALDYFDKCIEIASHHSMPFVEIGTYIFRAEAYLKKQMFKESIQDCLNTLKIIEKTKNVYHRGKVYTIIGKWLTLTNKDNKKESSQIINEILKISKLKLSPDDFFKKGIFRSKNPIFAETYIPALYEYAIYLFNDKKVNVAIKLLKEAYSISKKYGIAYEKDKIEKLIKNLNIKI